MQPVGYAWRPIEAPADPSSVADAEMRPLIRLWERQKRRLHDQAALHRFNERMARWWSIETGILERLYDLSIGATHLLIEQGFLASLLSHGDTNIAPEHLMAILGDHREALEVVMDLIGGSRELSVGWIKELHALMTRHQHEVDAVTPEGRWVKVPLAHGTYKTRPNNPIRPDGQVHEYCPPEHVAAEMDRLVALYHQLPAALPEVRSAWLHHAFTQIHPFQDGNGRVARALASVDLIRAGLFPLLIERGDKETRYLPALEAADTGNLRPLVDLFARCMERVTMRAIAEAEQVVEEPASFAAVLEAGRRKLAARAEQGALQRELWATRLTEYAECTRAVLEEAAQATVRSIEGIRAAVRQASSSDAHFYRRQIVALARHRQYWVDLREERSWVRMRLRDGGITDLVVSLHLIGNPSPGICVADVFLEHRDLHEDESKGSADLLFLDVEPLLIAIDEDIAPQRDRLRTWLEQVKIQGVAQWLRYL